MALHSPWSLPGSHSTVALPPEAEASQLAEQSAYAFTSTPQCGGCMSIVTFAPAPSFARKSPMIFALALQASSPVFASSVPPRSLLRPPQATLRSASILSAKAFTSTAAIAPALSLPAASPWRLNSFWKSKAAMASAFVASRLQLPGMASAPGIPPGSLPPPGSWPQPAATSAATKPKPMKEPKTRRLIALVMARGSITPSARRAMRKRCAWSSATSGSATSAVSNAR